MSHRFLTGLAFPFVLSLVSFTGCNKNKVQDGDPIRLEWSEGETFHVAAAYRRTAVMTEETHTSLEDLADGIWDDSTPVGEQWTDELVWTYQVVESDFKPGKSDELYEYSVTATGARTTLAVIKVSVDETLNDDPELLESDPVVYLVFREDRDRLAGIITYTNVDDERVEHAYSSNELGRSWSTLSQATLSKVPTYLAPFSATWGSSERTLEDGSLVTSVKSEYGVVDTIFDDEMDGTLVASRYEVDQPWPTWTVSANMESRLLDTVEVANRRAQLPYLYPEEPEQFDYRAALSASIDIDEAMRLDESILSDGGFEAEVADEYKPWAGSWWPLAKGELVFGYDNRDTISDIIEDDVKEIKVDMDELSEALRDMDESDDGYDEKVQEYRDQQKELVDLLVEFYNGILEGLDGGQINIESGVIAKDDEWSYDIDELSPMDKFALVEYLEGNTNPNPFYLPASELLNMYNPGGGSWWGHCNGWAAAAILTNEPTESIDVTVGDGVGVTFTTADIKGLLTEAHYSTNSRFYGERYNGEEDDMSDLSPSAFQKLINFYIREQGVSLVFDTEAKEAVWNFPAYAVDVDMTETTASNAYDLINVNTADLDTLDTLPGVGGSIAEAIIEYREEVGPFQSKEELKDVNGIGNSSYSDMEDLITIKPIERTFDVMAVVTLTSDGVDETHVDDGEPDNMTESWGYTLVTNADGLVIDGAWTSDSNHPDFAWVPYYNARSAARGSSENAYLDYGHMLDLLGEDIERK